MLDSFVHFHSAHGTALVHAWEDSVRKTSNQTNESVHQYENLLTTQNQGLKGKKEACYESTTNVTCFEYCYDLVVAALESVLGWMGYLDLPA